MEIVTSAVYFESGGASKEKETEYDGTLRHRDAARVSVITKLPATNACPGQRLGISGKGLDEDHEEDG